MVHYFWRQIPNHHPHVVLDQFVVMPDHVHGVVGIVGSDSDQESVGTVGTCHGMSPQMGNHATGQQKQAQFGKPQSKSLSMIINHYKGAITRWCRRNGYPDFAWQSRFYDHIIRNDRSLRRIRQYIYDNPLRWQRDHNQPDRVHEEAVEYIGAG